MNGKVNKRAILQRLVAEEMAADGTVPIETILSKARKLIRGLPPSKRQAVYASDVHLVASQMRGQRGMQRAWISKTLRKDVRYSSSALQLAALLIEECGGVEKGIVLLESLRNLP